MSDISKRPLQIPPWLIPYVEKHRLYELFHELARELVIQQPEDHVSFIKQILLNTCRNRDNARVILICPPRTNCDKIAYRIGAITKQIVITKEKLETYASAAKRTLQPRQIAKLIAKLVRKDDAYKQGWILVNCLKSETEARALLDVGILPTHCFYLVSSFYPPIDELQYCDVPIGWPESRRQLIALRNVFKHVLTEIHLQQLTPEELAKKCVDIIQTRKGKVSMIPRIVLIGPRGSGRRTQAKMLSKSMNLIHIDFEYLLCQAWLSENELSTMLHDCEEKVCYHSELLVLLINKRILEADCLKNGWVLTGFPFTKIDLMFLDCVDTPPNRIIILECDLNVCRERVTNRRFNMETASEVNIKDKANARGKKLELHPNDKINLVNAENLYYCQQYPQIRDYCGGTAITVNADQQERWVHECIMGIIVRESPPHPPRRPFEQVNLPPRPAKIEDMFDLCKCAPFPPKMKDMFIFDL